MPPSEALVFSGRKSRWIVLRLSRSSSTPRCGWIHGIEPTCLDGLAEYGFGDVSPSKLVEMKIHGISPESIRELQERGLEDLTVDELIETVLENRLFVGCE